MPNLSRLPDERSHYRAPSMIWLARSSSFTPRSSGRLIAAVRIQVLAGATLALLIVAAVELHPVTPAPVDRGHPWDCDLWRYCE